MMMIKRICVTLASLFWIVVLNAQQIIPAPAEVIPGKGSFTINSGTKILIDRSADSAADFIGAFADEINNGLRFKPVIRSFKGSTVANAITFAISDKSPQNAAEAYTINIRPGLIKVQASDGAGLFYAVQSLTQLFSKPTIAAMIIKDHPQYGYRGMHLDVSRHFFSVKFIKHYLDLMARYKFNTFHWHLTDSHGWRMEIKQYPKLTSVGAWRAERNVPMTMARASQPDEPKTYGGFYTQKEIRDVIAYAQKLYISIIPEIELPGHCTAALVAYPEYSTQNGSVPLLIPTGYGGDLLHNICVGNDSSFLFINNILREVMDVFPSQYIHIGGDEVKAEPWLRCPRCSKRMKDLGFTDKRQLQAYFTARVDSFVNASGRTTLGWDEILEAGDLSKNAAVISWRGIQGGIDGAKKGHRVIMAPYRYAYFDFYQSDPSLEQDISYAGLFLDSVYAFNPRPSVLTQTEAANIMGAQACLWTENIKTEERVEYMLLPRMPAFAEAIWTPRYKKNYRSFIKRLENELTWYDKQKINYAKSMYNTAFEARYDTVLKGVEIRLRNQVADLHSIRFTIDGSDPDLRSPVYKTPFLLKRSAVVKSAVFSQDGKVAGKINEQRFSLNLATGKQIKVQSIQEGNDDSKQRLVDGIFGTAEPYDNRWVFYNDSVLTINVDLGKSTVIDSIRLRCLEDSVGNAFLPGSIIVSASADGSSYSQLSEMSNTHVPLKEERHYIVYPVTTTGLRSRYIQVVLKRSGVLPPDAKQPVMFTDEIEVF